MCWTPAGISPALNPSRRAPRTVEIICHNREITSIDPENIQFCCAEWFWNKQVNSYALQVVPDRFKHQDTAIIDFKEALLIEKIRNTFFIRLRELLEYTKKPCAH